MTPDATPFNEEDLRTFATFLLADHDPAQQEGNGYERCAECHYTRHPCDTYDLAAATLGLLEEVSLLRRVVQTLDAQIRYGDEILWIPETPVEQAYRRATSASPNASGASS